MTDYNYLHESLKTLGRFFEKYRQIETSADEDQLHMYKMAIVHEYEVCYGAMFKALDRHLQDLGVQTDPAPKNLIRVADKSALLGSSPEQWFKYVDARNSTSYDHGDEIGDKVLDVMPDFMDDAIGLYQTMSGESWE